MILRRARFSYASVIYARATNFAPPRLLAAQRVEISMPALAIDAPHVAYPHFAYEPGAYLRASVPPRRHETLRRAIGYRL